MGGAVEGAVMSERTCNIAGCHNPAESNGLCAHHFTRALVYRQLRVANHAASLSGAVPRGEAEHSDRCSAGHRATASRIVIHVRYVDERLRAVPL